MVVTQDFITANYPLHHLVWHNDAEGLERAVADLVKEKLEGLEKLDPRGRTPLMLAVKLGHLECVTTLLSYDANVHFEHSSGWTIVHEAVCTGNAEVLGAVLKFREIQRRNTRSHLIPQLLRRLSDAPDFYVEMKWDFSSWVPLVSRMCPTNTHRVYKMGSCLRVDSSDNNFEENGAGVGGISVIFQGKGDHVKMIEIDHKTSQVFISHIMADADKSSPAPDVSWYQKSISQRLSNPVILTYVNLEKITFERNKTGIWGWGSDKSEKIREYECKVFGATNVELVTKMRYEHLAEGDKTRCLTSSNLQKILNTLGTDVNDEDQPMDAASAALVTEEEYFDESLDLRKADVGKPMETRTKVNKFKATVWLSETYPLNLQEQLMPIVDIMALSSPQFSKLKDFIQMQIPSGFPVKIEIPLFHLVNTCITFYNIFGMETPITGVTTLEEEEGRISCVLEEDLFEPPLHYSLRNSVNKLLSSSEDDLFLWNADESSEQIDIYQALNAPRPSFGDLSPGSSEEERLLQRAIEESIRCAHLQNYSILPAEGACDNSNASSFVPIARSESAEELQMILELSRREVEEQTRLLRDEEETLNKILQLSLQER